MLIKNFNRKTAVISAAAFTFFQYIFLSPVWSQSNTNGKTVSQKRSKSSTIKTNNSKASFQTVLPSYPLRKRKLSGEDIKAAGNDSNKFYRLAEQKEKAGKLDQAKQLYYKAIVARSEIWGQYDPAIAKIAVKMGQIELKQKHPNTARTWFKEALKSLSKKFGSGDYELVPVLEQLAKLDATENDHASSSSYYEHILLLEERKFGEEGPQAIPTRISYIEELIADKDPSEAEKVTKKAIEIEKKTRGAASQNLPKFEQLLSVAQSARANNSSK